MIKILFRIFPFLSTVAFLSVLSWAEAKSLFSLDPHVQETLTVDEGILFSADMLLGLCVLLWILYAWLFSKKAWSFWKKIFTSPPL